MPPDTAIEPGRRIIQLTSENVKRLKAISISPDGKSGLVQVTGRNGQGKTSILDSIQYAIGGTKGLPEQPLRTGESRAKVVVDLGDIVVTREFTPLGSTLTVRNADGSKFDKPQTLLDKLMGALTFDPLEFTRQKPAAQRDTLMRVAGLDFADLDLRRSGFFGQRTDANRDLAREQARLSAIPIQSPRPVRVDIDTVTKEYEDALRAEEKRRELDNDLYRAGADVTEIQDNLNLLQAQMEDLRTQLTKRKAEQVALQGQLVDAPVSQVDAKRQAMNAATATNQAAAQADAREDLAERVKQLGREADSLSKEIEAVDKEKQARIQGAALPVEGLSVSDAGVLFNGVPFEQASGAQKIRVSVAMAIALNPNLRVMLVRDGSLLDHDSMQVLEELAVQHNAQVWVERVDADGPSFVVVEDGEIVEAHEEAPAADTDKPAAVAAE